MKYLVTLSLAVALCLVSASAFAYSSLIGATGGLLLPNASVVAPSAMDVAVDYQASLNGQDASESFRFQYGAMQNLEVGVAYDALKAGGNDINPWGINAKYAFPNLFWNANLGVGAVYYSGDQSTSIWQLYAVASKQLMNNPALNGSLGVNWTQAKAGGVTNSAFRPFIAVDATLIDKLDLGVEYQFKNDDIDSDAMYSIYARYPFTDALSAQVGYSNATALVAGGDDSAFTVGVNYAFGGK